MEERLSSVPEEKATMYGFSKVFNTYFEPRKVFGFLKIKPTWLVPFIIFVVLGLVTTWFMHPLRMKQVITNIEENERYTEEQKEVIIERIGTSDRPPIYQIGVIPLFILGYLILFSGILFFVFSVLLGGDSSFKRVLSVFSYSTLIAIPQSIVHLPLAFAKQTADVNTSLAIFLSTEAKGTFFHSVLKGFDIFTLWQVIVLSIGLAVMYNYTTKKSFTVVLILWVLLIVVGAGLSGLFGGMLGLG
ncbi:MAG: YIP1 family protein [Candidatus Zixiibacteriota bacterium]